MLEEQQNALVNIVYQNTTPLQTSVDKLKIEIKDKRDQLNNTKKNDDLKVSIETYQNITDYESKDAENPIDKIKRTKNIWPSLPWEFFHLLWEHQGFWESKIFREFLKFIKVLWLKSILFKKFVFRV